MSSRVRFAVSILSYSVVQWNSFHEARNVCQERLDALFSDRTPDRKISTARSLIQITQLIINPLPLAAVMTVIYKRVADLTLRDYPTRDIEPPNIPPRGDRDSIK